MHQQIDTVLVFDIWGDYAHFRKIETTTSPLTYSIPTITGLSGLISAIIGRDRDSYYMSFTPESARFAIRILNPIRKVRININLIKTDEGFFLWDIRKTPRTPTPFEFLKDPKYRIYVWLKDKKMNDEVKEYLRNHKSFYTPYLGISELIADFNFIGECEAKFQKAGNNVNIDTVMRKNESKLIPEEGKIYRIEKIPTFMNEHRVVREYNSMLFEAGARSIKVENVDFYKIGEENVVFV